MPEPLLALFAYAHLSQPLQMVAKPFHDLAHAMVLGDNAPLSGTVTFGPGLPATRARAAALADLLVARDAALCALLAT